MSKYIPDNQKLLTLENRIYIENELNKGTSFNPSTPSWGEGADDSGLGNALVLDTGHHRPHCFIIPNLERVVFESVKFVQLDIDNLFLSTAGRLFGSELFLLQNDFRQPASYVEYGALRGSFHIE